MTFVFVRKLRESYEKASFTPPELKKGTNSWRLRRLSLGATRFLMVFREVYARRPLFFSYDDIIPQTKTYVLHAEFVVVCRI